MQKMKMLVGSLLCAAAVGVQAHEAGDWIVRAGAAQVNPNDDSSTVRLNGDPVVKGGKATVDSDTQLGLTGVYMVTNNVGVELLAATPFKHDIHANGKLQDALGGVDDLGSTKQLPPTVSLQYYFNNSSKAVPYVGIGVNYTNFFDEDASGDLENALGGHTTLDLDNSWGMAAQAGVDYMLTDHWLLNAAVWYIDIDTTATYHSPAGTVKADVEIDPWVYMVGVGYKF